MRHVAIGDIMKLRDDAEFVDANKRASRTFPVVVASEVIEHFRKPPDDFSKLFKFVKADGLLVCGTNIYDGGNLSRDAYIHLPTTLRTTHRKCSAALPTTPASTSTSVRH